MPVYNVGQYLYEMLESIYRQTFKNFEIIIVNDGSTDNSEKIILEYKKKYKNITYIKQENKGQSEARNVSLSKIKGKYTLFLDSDDYIEVDMLERMYTKAENNLADITICAFKKVYDYKHNNTDNILFNADINKIYDNTEVMEMMLEYKVKGYLWNKMFLTKNILKSNMYFEKGRIIEDLFPVFKQVSLSNRIVFINEPLYNYRQRLSSSLHIKKSLKSIDDYSFAVTSVSNYAKKNNGINKDKYYIFVANAQAVQLHDFMKLGVKCKREIYRRCTIEDFSLYKILFKMNISNKIKFKLILFKLNILHICYKLEKV
jgi:glycosyltransferase involved in cell wall biosynthesis